MQKNLYYLIQAATVLVFSGLFYLTGAGQDVLSTVLFLVGAVLGAALLYVDEAILSEKYAEQGVTGQVVMTRSLLFVVTLIPLAIFVITSSGSSIGMGLLLLLLSGVLLEMIAMRKQVEQFNHRFLSQLKNPWNQNEMLVYIAILVFFWLLLLLNVFIV